MKKAWLNSDQMKKKVVYRQWWAAKSGAERRHDFNGEVKIPLDWTTGEGLKSAFCYQRAKQIGVRRWRQK